MSDDRHAEFLAVINRILDQLKAGTISKEQANKQLKAATKQHESTWTPEQREEKDKIPSMVAAQLEKLGWREFNRRLSGDGVEAFLPVDPKQTDEQRKFAILVYLSYAEEEIKKARAKDLRE
jgi:hypothetical protein